MKLLLVSSTASMLIQEIQLKGIITIVCTLYLGSNTFCRKKQLVQHWYSKQSMVIHTRL